MEAVRDATPEEAEAAECEEDEEEALMAALRVEVGADKAGLLSLIHQLLVCEDAMSDANRPTSPCHRLEG
jgi:hypothetical protein